MINMCLFETPVKSKKVRRGEWAHQYRNGNINIMGQMYVYYSMTEAISLYRKQFPKYKTKCK